MARKLLKDIGRGQDIYRITKDFHSPSLGEYYFLMNEKELLEGHSQDFHFDERGIPVIPTYIDVDERRLIYYPISIGQYGLAIYHTFLSTKSKSDRERFLKIVDWFYENRISDERLGDYWLTDVPKPEYRINEPWPSAFSQSRAISILLRGFQLTNNKSYLGVSHRALKIFHISANEGGVTSFTQYGPFYEEYPAPFPTMVLDGMFFSLCGLYDYVRAGEDPEEAKSLFRAGIDTLEKILPTYDLGYWIRYNQCHESFYPEVDPATIGYLRLVINQLQLFYRLTGKEIFHEIAEKWKQYDRLSNIIRMYIVKFSALRKLNRL
ncbi:MAG: hypothetical protein EH225_11885 [Calditrichaeota bacterium]|nr:MAG: hypothetical protein EH225_11885 [Calditrichota bacterium]